MDALPVRTAVKTYKRETAAAIAAWNLFMGTVAWYTDSNQALEVLKITFGPSMLLVTALFGVHAFQPKTEVEDPNVYQSS